MLESAAVVKLTEYSLPEEDRRLALRAFARENGWHPSDEILSYRGTSSYATGHLLVEHGLDNTAAITFLHRSTPFSSLRVDEQRSIICLSYNNLVDWHLFPDPLGVARVFNRSQPLKIQYVPLSEDPGALGAESFDRVVGRRPNPNVPALDEALISTVARWRRILASELNLANNTGAIAELFNAIFFVRALEDHRTKNRTDTPPQLLVRSNQGAIRETILHALEEMTSEPPPSGLIDVEALRAFDPLDRDTQVELLSDFYQNRFAPYAYDFSLMSKHALSRIYERYISILRPTRTAQQLLFGTDDSVSESARRDRGEVYTPQYIARFFSRFLKENTTPARFRSLVALDPACGSGIFLRTLLETQCDPLATHDLEAVVEQAFANVHGVDVEENACKATRLS